MCSCAINASHRHSNLIAKGRTCGGNSASSSTSNTNSSSSPLIPSLPPSLLLLPLPLLLPSLLRPLLLPIPLPAIPPLPQQTSQHPKKVRVRATIPKRGKSSLRACTSAQRRVFSAHRRSIPRNGCIFHFNHLFFVDGCVRFHLFSSSFYLVFILIW
jgi:hypothetical protein